MAVSSQNMPIKSAEAMVAKMTPKLDSEIYIYCAAPTIAGVFTLQKRLLDSALAIFHESEGTTLILTYELASQHGFDTALPMKRITLEVYSALDGVGLTAAVATALTEEGIPCNMVAAYHHDHLFVPAEMAENAMNCLRVLQTKAKDRARQSSEAVTL